MVCVIALPPAVSRKEVKTKEREGSSQAPDGWVGLSALPPCPQLIIPSSICKILCNSIIQLEKEIHNLIERKSV